MFPFLCWVVLSLALILCFLDVGCTFCKFYSLCSYCKPGNRNSRFIEICQVPPCCLRMVSGISCVSDMAQRIVSPAGQERALQTTQYVLRSYQRGKKGNSHTFFFSVAESMQEAVTLGLCLQDKTCSLWQRRKKCSGEGPKEWDEGDWVKWSLESLRQTHTPLPSAVWWLCIRERSIPFRPVWRHLWVFIHDGRSTVIIPMFDFIWDVSSQPDPW